MFFLLQFIRRTIIIKEKLLLRSESHQNTRCHKNIFTFKENTKKLAVFLYLAKQTNLDLSSVARKFDLSTKNLSIYLREIQEDLATLPENTLEIQIHHGKISLHTTSNDFLSHYFLLFNYYCVHSTDFILFQAIIKKKTILSGK